MVSVGSTGMKRSTRSFVDKGLRSGKRLFADRYKEEVKRMRTISVASVDNHVKKIKLIDCDNEIDDDAQTESFKLGKFKKNSIVNRADEVLEVDLGESKQVYLVAYNHDDGDNANRINRFGFVYSRKRKRYALNGFDEKKKVKISDGKYVSKKVPMVFAASYSYGSDDNSCSVYQFSCFVSLVLRYLRMTKLFSWRRFKSFLLLQPNSSMYSSIGNRFLQDSSYTTSHGLFKLFGSIDSIPLFTLNFSSLHFFFMYIHLNLLLKHTFLSSSLLNHLTNKNATISTLKWDPPLDKLVVAKKSRSSRKRIPRFSLFNKLSQTNALTRVESIVPVPVVREIVGYEDDDYVPFILPESYISSRGDEVSRTLERSYPLYDMDSDDEQWLKKFDDNKCVSEDVFVKIIGAFERGIYCSPHDYSEATLAVDRCSELASNYVLENVYSYWMSKRKKKRSALIRVFQCYKQKRVKRHFASVVLRKKRSFRRRASQRFEKKKIDFKKAIWNDEKLLKESTKAYIKLHETQDSAKRSEEAFIVKRKQAQDLMEVADMAVYKATMALKIAEALRAGVSVDHVTGATFGSYVE